MIRTGLLAFLLTGAVFCFSNLKGPIVTTPLGSVLGIAQSSRKGFQYYSFRGIRYAEPPVRDLRFKPPVPVKPWDKVFDATKDGPACYQPDDIGIELSEDCLRLNVYTRRINATLLRPVLVFIHGGAFGIFSGTSALSGPDYIMDHDIVMVTLNYRLGALGFFSTGDKHAPGNYGLKDQVQALRWVRDNIRYFGGDPSRVTISGFSAGSASVGLHLVSPMSRGLFHGAVQMSGSSTNFCVVNKNPMPLAQKQAVLLNCPTNDTESMIDCIKKLPADRIANTYPKLAGWKTEPIVIYSSVIESGNGGTDAFLTKHPNAALLEGDIAQVPVFIGITKDEFALQAYTILQNKDWAADLSKNWNKIAPILFTYEPNDAVSQKLRKYYLGSSDQPLTSDSSEALGRLYADGIIIFGVVRSAKLIADKNPKPVYLYRFTYEGEHRAVIFPKSLRNVPGVFHADDLIYAIYTSRFTPVLDPNTEDGRCVDRFTTLINNFVNTGNPTPEPSAILTNVIWTPYTNGNPSYLEINQTLNMSPGIFFQDRMSLWESLFPLNN